MNTQLILIIGELLLRYGPGFIEQMIKLFSKNTDPTAEELQALMDLAKKSYKDYVGHDPIP